jgi:hypothetical protein
MEVIMRNIVSFLILLFIINGYSQEVLRKGETYTADSTSIIMSEKQFVKMDSLLIEGEKNQREKELYKKRAAISDSVENGLKLQLDNLGGQVFLLEKRIELNADKDTLRQEQLRIKDDIIVDLEKDLNRYRGKKGFSNNFLWFGSGTIVGALTIYLSSVILSNISN